MRYINIKHNTFIEKYKKLIENSIPLNNEVFMIFAKNKKFCEEFLRVILRDKKLIVIDNDIQKHLPSAFNKSVIIDMLCRLSNGDIVNVEIQLSKEKHHAKRIFTYASKIKSYIDEKGEEYRNLKEVIIIYLTKEDIFKKGSTVYKVDMNIISDKKIFISNWNCGLKVYYVNAEGLTNKTINEYLKLLTDKKTTSKKFSMTSSIKKGIYEIGGKKMSKEWKELYDGIENIGIEKGKKEGKISAFIEMVNDKLLTIKEAAKRVGMTEKEFSKLVN